MNPQELRVALVHEALTIPGGAEKVLFALHELFPKAPIFTPLYQAKNFPQLKDATVITSSLNRWSFWRNHHQLANPLLPYYMEQFDLSEFDLVISISTAAAKGVLTRPETIHICYCNTPMRWAWMPYLDKRASQSWLRRMTAHYLRLWDAASVSRVDFWLANSHTTKARVKKFYDRDATTIYPPIAAVDTAKASYQSDDFYLTVGRLIQGNKRIDIIIEAAKLANIPLKIVGDGPDKAVFQKMAAGHKNIEFLGFLSDEKRNDLYARCKAFLFASEEDFGIVPVEAMAYGKPVIAFGRGGAGETVKDGITGIHFAEQTADSLATAIERFKGMEFNPESIASHARTFSPARFRHEIMDYITTCLKSRS